MILALALAVGAIGLGISQILILMDGDITLFNGTIAVLAWTAIAAGIWGAQWLPQMTRAGRVGIVMICFAALSFGMVMIIMLTSGTLGALRAAEISYGDIVFTPFYVLALIFLVAGMIGTALHFLASGSRWLVLAFTALAIVHMARPFSASLLGFHAAADLALACALLTLSGLVLRRGKARAR